MKKKEPFSKKAPCANCPYRKDAPLRLWSVEEFKDLAASETTPMGKVYGCHKGDGCVCVGWLMKQEEADFPSISLRVSLSRNNVTREYLDSLQSPAPLFDTVEQMCKANYPEAFPGKT